MEAQLKHQATVQAPDISPPEIVRSERRNKTMLKSFKLKDPSTQDLSNIAKDQKLIKTLVESKIEELHSKMKNFFTQSRKTHLQEIAPQLQELKQAINELKQELSRPKSTAQVQEQKHGLLMKKNFLLKEIQQINKRLKQNKNHYFHMKLQSQQLDRQLNNGHATIQKYKQRLSRLESSQMEPLINQTRIIGQGHKVKGKLNQMEHGDLQRILNDSLIDQDNSQTIQNQPNHQKSQQSTYQQSDHIHITQITDLNSHKSKSKLPLIHHSQKTKNSTYFSTLSHPEKLNIKFKQFNSVRNTQTPQFLNQKQQKRQSEINFTLKNQLTEILNNNTQNSNTSFDQYLRQYPIKTSLNTSQIGMEKHYNGKITKSKRYPLDLTLEIRKYQQLVNKEKWNKVESLFVELEKMTVKEDTQPQENDANIVHVTNLEQLLMEELRKQQFSTYKEKGYHEGLKDKTHQIKIELKRIFKNFSADQFFSQVISKKPIKKELTLILQNCIQ